MRNVCVLTWENSSSFILLELNSKLTELDLGVTKTIEFDDHIIIGLDRKFLKLNDDKPIEFNAKINEHGKIVLESSVLTKLSSTGTDNCVKR